jgi:CheY-like chemotaxis protein
MHADSDGPGKGSIFTVYLPTREATALSAVTAGVADDRRPRALDLRGKHVLIVDDDRDAREVLRAMLSTTGVRISEAESARAALRLIEQDRPDLVLADIAMPGEDGYSLVQAMRALDDRDGDAIRAIAVSAYARREDKQRARGAGFDDHIAKPIQLDELFATLERVWQSRQTPFESGDVEPGANIH